MNKADRELLEEQYDDWWENVGIKQKPHDEDSFKQFVKRVAKVAWQDGYDLCNSERVQTMEADIKKQMEEWKETL